MKSVFAATAIALTLSTSAFAATIEGADAVGGVVHFTGFITDSTCSVNGMENPFEDSLDLGTYVSTDFGSAGDVSTSVPLTLELTDCPDSITGVSLRITSEQGEDATQPGAYKIADGSAEGVAIRLNDDEGAEITYGEESKTYDVTGGVGTVTVEAQYVATKAGTDMTPGHADLDATFAINYK
ncbi:type 1 fimbrial protein [Vibrio alginolyticus]|nr:type 1 fimbrial protein [Vibrio alginolyticus]